LIDDLLNLTRIESGRKKRDLVDLDVREVAAIAIEDAAAAAHDRGIELHLHAPPSVPMLADRGELENILNNLISNAVKYNRDDGRVDVFIGAEDGAVRIAVKDTGIGLAPDEVARLFQEFVRIKSERTRAVSGTGLGLSIVKKVAQLYGGDVTVDSQAGVGSTFTVLLPVPVPAPVPVAAEDR
jgi:two-component system, sensor histidine kinase and response regulator